MEYLMDLLAEELSHTASSIFKHTLMGLLETAVRSSNAQYHDPEFLSRLEVKLLEQSPGDRGWEIFCLDYQVSNLPPLVSVFTPDVMMKYQRIFNFLWRLKRVDYALSTSWSQNMAHRLQFAKIPGIKDHFHKFNLYRHEMQHFVSNVHNYIMVEVLQSAWKIFQDDLKAVKDLDQLIEVQHKFMNSILDKSLLSEKNQELYRQLQKLLNYVYTFTFIQQTRLFKSALDEYQRLMDEESKEDETEISTQAVGQLIKIHQDFKKTFQEFKTTLNETKDQTNLKYLQARLDFNKYYESLQMQEEWKPKRHGFKDDLDILDVSDYSDEDDVDYGEDDDEDDEDDGTRGGKHSSFAFGSIWGGEKGKKY